MLTLLAPTPQNGQTHSTSYNVINIFPSHTLLLCYSSKTCKINSRIWDTQKMSYVVFLTIQELLHFPSTFFFVCFFSCWDEHIENKIFCFCQELFVFLIIIFRSFFYSFHIFTLFFYVHAKFYFLFVWSKFTWLPWEQTFSRKYKLRQY